MPDDAGLAVAADGRDGGAEVTGSPSTPRLPGSTTAPFSSTFQGAKWCRSVNGVPYRAVAPSPTTVSTANRDASGNSCT